MEVRYETTKEFTAEQLKSLFLSVEWSSGSYPEQLVTAMKNSHSVYSAWHGDELVGLINCLSDGIMTAYFHYLLVNPEFQNKGVGKKLVELMLDKYKDYARKVLIAYNNTIPFYQSCGFEIAEGNSPMFITEFTD